MPDKYCAVDGCNNKLGPRTKKIYCMKHEYHFKRYGSATHYEHHSNPVECIVESCHAKPHSLGYCDKHYKRLKEHGDSSIVKNLSTEFVSNHRLAYKSYYMMRARCYCPKYTQYKDYGGRGIKVCDRWMESKNGFINFINDMGDRPKGYSLDRIDVNGDYCPENCRWATRKEQANNFRRSRRITYSNQSLTISEWADKLCMPYYILYNRIMIYKWSIKRALEAPYKEKSK